MCVSAVNFNRLDAFITDSDLPYEYELIKDPSLNNWLRYYWAKDTLIDKLFVLQRACYALPRSYKLWSMYLGHYIELVQNVNPVEYRRYYLKVNDEFEKALELLNKMPMLWVKYLGFLMKQSDASLIRRKFNEALRNVSLFQHDKIWPMYLTFADEVQGTIGADIYMKYLTFEPRELELVLEKLIQFKDLKHSFDVFDKLISVKSNSLDIWLTFIDFLIRSKYDNNIVFENLVRNGISKFPDQIGRLYTKVATFYIKRNNHLKARQIFEEGFHKSLTIKDFTVIYDGYTEFEEAVITKLVKDIQELEDKGENNSDLSDELDMRLEKFQNLMEQRPFRINSIKLKQNPHNVEEWLDRIKLIPTDDLKLILQTYAKAITTIDPKKATPGLSKLWLQYSKIYEENKDLKTARTILDKAIKVPFNSPEELVNIWIEWAELELRQNNIELAIRVMEVATKGPENSKISYNDDSLPVQARIHKSIKLWSFYLDLVESSDDIVKTSEIYEKLFELKIATPLTVINYANFLEDNNRFEQAFKIYERGIAIFKYPVVFEIWNIYLTKAIKRNLPLERVRDLFDHSLENCPPNLSKHIYLLFSKFEQDNGSISKAMKILKDAISNVVLADQVEIFETLIQLTIDHFGLTSSRDVFQQAISAFAPNQAIHFVLKFAEVETQLREYERVRSLLKYGALLQSVPKNAKLWEFWNDFEVEYGNKETYKEMLKFKRQANDKFHFDSETLGFVKSSDGPKVSSINASEDTETTEINPDAIDLDI